MFNNHLLVFHWWAMGEDPLKVPLVFAFFWVQIHDVLPGFFFFVLLARQLDEYIGNFVEYDSESIVRGLRNFMRVRVYLDMCLPLKRKKKLLFSLGNINYVYFRYERLTLFCFFFEKLVQNDSFYQERMALGVEITVMGSDLSIRAQSKRALAMNSVWLRDGGEGMEWGETMVVCAQGIGHGGQ